jgi:hypothetical protein
MEAKATCFRIFASMVAVFEMDGLKIRPQPNRFALRSKIGPEAVRSIFDEIQKLKNAQHRL